MPIELRPLDRSSIEDCRSLLAAACEFDRADRVCEEKVFGPAPGELGRHPVGAFSFGKLVGLAVTSADRLRLLAVEPARRGRGIGTALLATAESEVAGHGKRRLRTGDQPGNYLAPGIDQRNDSTIRWFERRGYLSVATNTNLQIDVATNGRVCADIFQRLCARANERGYHIGRAEPSSRASLSQFIGDAFSPIWAFEVERAFGGRQPGVFVATLEGRPVAFAAHDGNNRGLGWFGPAGTVPAHRSRGLGEALLLGCLLDVAAQGHAQCEIAWVGPRAFYEKSAGIAGERTFVVLEKELNDE